MMIPPDRPSVKCHERRAKGLLWDRKAEDGQLGLGIDGSFTARIYIYFSPYLLFMRQH